MENVFLFDVRKKHLSKRIWLDLKYTWVNAKLRFLECKKNVINQWYKFLIVDQFCKNIHCHAYKKLQM